MDRKNTDSSKRPVVWDDFLKTTGVENCVDSLKHIKLYNPFT